MSANQNETLNAPKPPSGSFSVLSTQILGVRVDAVNQEKALGLLDRWLNTSKQYQISTPNPEQVMLAKENQAFRDALNQSDLNIPDGIGLVWAMKKVMKPKKGRIPTYIGIRPWWLVSSGSPEPT
jgi:UDP-N-acetyl-D-mannosaminuronic acid transferase (WecB/TagA/CpsF family)